MDSMPLWGHFALLAVLFALSAFFSGSETALMALNRYRLQHRAEMGERGAKFAQSMLDKPDRLIGVILLGNNLVNIFITQLATYVGYKISGEIGVAIATAVLTILLLIFAELTPKTLAAAKSESIAYPASYLLRPLMSRLSPMTWIAWLVNQVANNLLRIFGVDAATRDSLALSSDELKSVVNEGDLIPSSHQEMLGNILDLEKATVEDIMIPRKELIGIDLNDAWESITAQLINSQHTRLPVFKDSMDHIIGFVHLRKLLVLLQQDNFTRSQFEAVIRPAYFVPEGTTLTKQLLAFKNEQRRIGLVVDEYGDIQGLITLEDILEEIVGEFTTDPATDKDFYRQHDGTYIVDAATHPREINRVLGWNLPVDGAKTLNGIITEKLEEIPQAGTTLNIGNHFMEIISTGTNAIKIVRLIDA